MQKLIKLTGVSILAIVASVNANAAGYTCEELIEYTSCNDGYVLTSDNWTGKCVEVPTCNAGSFANASCPDGYWLATGVCENAVARAETKEECDEYDGTWYDMSCALNGYNPNDDTVANLPVSYACSACPATGLTDKDGKTVVATTAGAGATSPAACYVGSEYYFTDTKGTYHYTSDCGLRPWTQPVTSEEECMAIAAAETKRVYSEDTGEVLGWEWGPDICIFGYHKSSFAPTTEAECNALAEKNTSGGYIEWEDNQCVCYDEWNWNEDGLSCYGAY